MAPDHAAPRHAQAGVMLLAIAILMFLFVAVVGGLLMRSGSDAQQTSANTAQDGMNALKERLTGFVANRRRLPTPAEYLSLSSGVVDALGKTPVYLADTPLTSLATPLALCSTAATSLTLRDCAGDASCVSFTDTPNQAFVLVSGGLSASSSTAVAGQTTARTASAAVGSLELVYRYAPGTLTPDVGSATAGTVPYDDLVVSAGLAELRKAAGCPVESQGAIVEKGSEVRFLNQQTVLPPAFVGTAYSQGYDFAAYGAPDAAYSWSVTGLPAGLTLTPVSGQPTRATLSGTPNAGSAGSYSVQVTVTATLNGRTVQASKLFSLLVTDCSVLTPTGLTRTSNCTPPQVGTFDERQLRNECTGALVWETTANNCALPPTSVNQALSSTALSAAGVSVTNRNTGLTSITLGTTVIAADPSGSVISLIGTNTNADAIGVAAGPGSNTGFEVSGTESLSLTFGADYQSASLIFRALGRTPPSGYESAVVTFYDADGVTVVGSRTVVACTVNNQNNNTAVRFSNLTATNGASFKRIDVRPSTGADFYVGAYAACSGATCQASGTIDAECP
jgi:hypothetical protein